MSKIGKKPIEVPAGISVSVDKENNVTIKGPKGELKTAFDIRLKIEIKDNKIRIAPGEKGNEEVSPIWGLTRAMVQNMIVGVEKGYEKQLELQGVGFKVAAKGKDLEFSLGFSHPVIFKAVQGIDFKINKNIVVISGIDKQLVGQVAADIRSLREPEPYKGKGIRYVGEYVRKKEGKKVAGTTA